MNTSPHECKCFPNEFREMYTKLMLKEWEMPLVAEKTYPKVKSLLEDQCMRPGNIKEKIEKVSRLAGDHYIAYMCEPDNPLESCVMAI